MARTNRTSVESPSAESEGFDVPSAAANPLPPTPAPAVDDGDDADEPQAETPAPPERVVETPEQRKLMREKRIAKAEEEHLRRLTRQFPVVARLVAENENLKRQLKK